MAVRSSVLLAVLFAALGCGKSSPTPTGAGSKADPKGDSGGSYTIAIREKHAGEKYEVTVTATRSELSLQGNGKDQEPTQSVTKVTTKSVYTETVEAVDGAAVTKGTRAYTVAEGADFGKVVPLSYAGKTVAYQRKGEQMTFVLANGEPVPPGKETFALQNDFERNRPKGPVQLLPETAVKVGESWDVPAEKLTAVFGPGAQEAGVKASGRLEKVTTKDGKQYGVVTLRLQSSLSEKGGKDSLEWTYDGCIDGSVTDGTRKAVQTIQVPGGAIPDLTNVTETVIRPAK
jgi:hypothetical protein